ncbi:MAG TPA: HD domain-containing protein [Acidobacteriaceae bacterium]
MKDFYIADAPRFENQAVTSFFCLSSLSLRERKGGGGQYLALTLADKTGQMEARMWEEFAPVLETCAEGCYVKVQGLISKYQGKFQITLTRMRAVSDSEIDAADFVPTTQYDVAAMLAELRGYVEEFTNPHLRALVFHFLDDPAVGSAFQQAPAAKRLHHAWLGGLLEHVLVLVRVCRAMLPFYPEADPDLVLTGAILHDIGKVRELSWRSSFSYTLEGQLIGHISIAQRMLADAITAMDAEARVRAGQAGEAPVLFPEPLRLLVEHMILAHHGKLEFGSPKLPMTPEALLLSALDDLEAKFQTMRAEFAGARESGKGAEETTEWVRSMERPLFDSRRFLEAKKGSAEQTIGSVEGGE